MDILQTLSRADELYRERERAQAVSESVALLTGSAGAAERYEAQWRLARALFFLGQQAEGSGAKRQLHAAAIGAAERACSLAPGRVEGHFWLGVNLALFAEASGGIKALRAVMRARAALKRAIEIDAGYHGAGPLRVLARLEHKAPWFLGGSRKRSREHFESALRMAPSNSVTLLYAAELAIDLSEPGRAIELLEAILASADDPEWRFENERDKQAARSLLDRLRR